MARKKKPADPSAPLFDARLTTAPCVPAIRDKVERGGAAGYPGATDTTRRLLNYWFLTDHRLPNGRKFAYHYSQRYAIETLDLPLRSRQGPPAERPDRDLRRPPGLEAAAIRRLRPLLRQDGHRQRQDEGDGPGHRLAVSSTPSPRPATTTPRPSCSSRPTSSSSSGCAPTSRAAASFSPIPSSPTSCGSSGISSATCAARASGPVRSARCT